MTLPPPRRPRLVWRVYAFAAVMSIAMMIVLVVLPRYTRGARYLEPQAALFQYLVDRISLKNPEQFTETMVRIEARVRGKLSLFDAAGKMVRTNVTPPLEAASRAELRDLKTGKWSLSTGRIVVRSDDNTLVGVYHPNRPGFPWGYVLPLGAVMLLVVGAASVWFARRLASPLDQLASAARRFGEGDTSSRAKLDRDDELGDVGRAFGL